MPLVLRPRQSQCNVFTGCNAYTFDSANKYCMLFNTCPALSDQECEGCTTSQTGCISDQWDAKARFLMVTGGGGGPGGFEPPQGPGVQFNRQLRTALTSTFALALTHNQKTRPKTRPQLSP